MYKITRFTFSSTTFSASITESDETDNEERKIDHLSDLFDHLDGHIDLIRKVHPPFPGALYTLRKKRWSDKESLVIYTLNESGEHLPSTPYPWDTISSLQNLQARQERIKFRQAISSVHADTMEFYHTNSRKILMEDKSASINDSSKHKGYLFRNSDLEKAITNSTAALGIVTDDPKWIRLVINALNTLKPPQEFGLSAALMTVLLVSRHPNLAKFLIVHVQNSVDPNWIRNGRVCARLPNNWVCKMALRWEISHRVHKLHAIPEWKSPELPAESDLRITNLVRRAGLLSKSPLSVSVTPSDDQERILNADCLSANDSLHVSELFTSAAKSLTCKPADSSNPPAQFWRLGSVTSYTKQIDSNPETKAHAKRPPPYDNIAKETPKRMRA